MDRRRREAPPLKPRRASPKGPYGGDKELEAGSSAPYDDAAYYTKTYLSRADDVAFYVDLVRGKRRPSVLEYGVGNGRLALPMARAGAKVTGLDLSRPMLADLAARLKGEPEAVQGRVTWRRGDMRRARFAERFTLVTCPFNAFLHLYTRADVESFLARVRGHLAPGGAFVFDVSIPNAHELVRDPNRAYHCPRFRYPTTGEMVRYTERFDYDPVRQVLFVMAEFMPEGSRRGESWSAPLTHRQFYPQELEALLHYNGFAVDQIWGDYKRGALDRSSEVMIVTARARKGR